MQFESITGVLEARISGGLEREIHVEFDLDRVGAYNVPFSSIISSVTRGNVNMPGSSIGRICLGGAGRYVNAVQNSGTSGTYSTTVDPTNIPSPTGFVSAMPGDTWHFQFWYRDPAGGGSGFNFSNGLQTEFCN